MNGRTKQSSPARQSNPSASIASTSRSQEMNLVEDLGCYLKDYARQRPDVAAMCCFGVGFILGWKLKPW